MKSLPVRPFRFLTLVALCFVGSGAFAQQQTKPATPSAAKAVTAPSNPNFQKMIGNPSAPITMEVFGDFQCLVKPANLEQFGASCDDGKLGDIPFG